MVKLMASSSDVGVVASVVWISWAGSAASHPHPTYSLSQMPPQNRARLLADLLASTSTAAIADDVIQPSRCRSGPEPWAPGGHSAVDCHSVLLNCYLTNTEQTRPASFDARWYG